MNAKTVVKFRRKREGRTNYKKRLALLKSGLSRIVIRKGSRHITLQIVNYHPDGDKIITTLNSKILLKHGWKHSTKSIPAGAHVVAGTTRIYPKGVLSTYPSSNVHPVKSQDSKSIFSHGPLGIFSCPFGLMVCPVLDAT